MMPRQGPPAVLLVSPPSFSPTERFYIPCAEIPLNICYLAAYLEREGVRTDILDLEVEPSPFPFRKYLEERGPRIVGFTAFSPFIEFAHELARQVKEWNPAALTVLGGYHASAFPRQALEEFPAFDALVAGEGEITMRELVEHVRGGGGDDLSHIHGVSWRAPGGGIVRNPRRAQIADIDSLPFPAREKLKQDRYEPNPVNYMQRPTTALLASRGCHHNCTFCSKHLFKGERVRSADNIFAEMLHCRERFGTRDFRFYDDNLMFHREQAMRLCALLSDAGGFTFNCFSRVDTIDEELLRALKAAGCYQVKFGVETGSQKTLELIKKGITFEQSRRAVALAKKIGVECQISMMLGLPGETREDIEKTIRFAVELSPDLILFNIFKPIPGSVLYNKLKNQGLLLPVRWEDYLVKSPRPVVAGAFTAGQLAGFMKRAYFTYYFRPRYIAQRLKWLFRAPGREIKRYATAAGIFGKMLFGKS
jgi:anaerobic magnesium-protoporphyrin IX monomethyl ester cyclase